jgi:hypothetical protein
MNNSRFTVLPLCTAVLGSMTVALKAQRVLAKSAIRAEVIKVSKSTSKSGCIYGIEFDITQLSAVKAILEVNHIEAKEYLR